jgi:prevent-host-death family protein
MISRDAADLQRSMADEPYGRAVCRPSAGLNFPADWSYNHTVGVSEGFIVPEECWPVQDAKARFSELLDAWLKEGPQVVTRRGVDVAVLVPVGQWRRLQRRARRNLI